MDIRSIIITFILILPSSLMAKAQLTPRETMLHVFNRFAYGPRPEDAAQMLADLKKTKARLDAWFEQQLKPELIDDKAVAEKLKDFPRLSQSILELTQKATIMQDDKVQLAAAKAIDRNMELQVQNELSEQLMQSKVLRSAESLRQFEAVLTDFWFNHFNIDGRSQQGKYTTPSYEREAIRPHVFGSFVDLLKATAQHPAMLRYLGNANSRVMNKKQEGGINENYARELLELHTLGIDGGYSQKDVIELARIFTGWSLSGPYGGNQFVFKREWHDTQEKTFLGLKFPAGHAQDEGDRALTILAEHPSTARFIAKKLVLAFVDDKGDPALVEKLAQTFIDKKGDLTAVYRTLYQSPEFWQREHFNVKFKKPLHYVVSAVRAVDGQMESLNSLPIALKMMGEDLYHYGPPTGYSDSINYWLSTNLITQRLIFANRLVHKNWPGVLVPSEEKEISTGQELIAFLENDVLQARLEDASRRAILAALQTDKLRAGLKNSVNAPIDLNRYLALALGSPQFQKR
ncbi:MAG: DUF1800 domain-containing protein [Oligoflexus sp.]|nr:DUF1800 domain-containing protein [Oligoflexus sp.]